jgi:hypothetical protein
VTPLAPTFTDRSQLDAQMRGRGYAVLDPDSVCAFAGCTLAELVALGSSWHDLAPDKYLKDRGHYRKRRHSSYVVNGGEIKLAPHRAHWQPVEYNALHGGMERWFEPVTPDVAGQRAWLSLLLWLARVSSALKGPQPWFAEAHQFRIDTQGGIGRPTPEGAHRDGVDVVAVFLVAREGIKGGETRVFEADGPHGERFTLTQPWSLLLLDDERVIHESTPIQPAGASGGYRDTLVVTLRAGGFQGG